MTSQEPVVLHFSETDADAIDDILTLLADMINKTSSPIVRVCLEDVHEDIAHLTNHDQPTQKGQAEIEAA